MKLCIKCNKHKQDEEFSKDKKRKDGIQCYCKLCNKNYRKNNKANIKKYYLKNKDRERIQHKERQKIRRNNDNLFRLRCNLKSSISSSFKKRGFSKRSKTLQLIGCSYEELQQYLGIKPEGDIELDHICPCAQAKTEEELIKLQHYSNFRWLSADDNNTKKDKWTPEGEELCKKLLQREWDQ